MAPVGRRRAPGEPGLYVTERRAQRLVANAGITHKAVNHADKRHPRRHGIADGVLQQSVYQRIRPRGPRRRQRSRSAPRVMLTRAGGN